mgnify:CR=1 FL=1
MAIRRDSVTRINQAQKANLLTTGKGKPLNSQGNDGDLTFRRPNDSYRLYVKAAGRWHGVKMGEAFDSLEKAIDDIESKVNLIKQFKLPSTYSVTGDFTLDASGDINLDADGGQIYLKDNGVLSAVLDTSNGNFIQYGTAGSTDDYAQLATTTNGAFSLLTIDAAGTNANISLNADGNITFNSKTGDFIAQRNSTEFSVANSAYAGMILGFQMIGEDESHQTYTLTTSYAVPTSAMNVKFVAPPSGNVEITVQIELDAASGTQQRFGLSDNATYNSIGNTYQHVTNVADETDRYLYQHMWVVTGLTPGTAYQYWLGAKTSSTSTSGFLRWGGTSDSRFGDFIMKAVALPAATTDFAVYD